MYDFNEDIKIGKGDCMNQYLSVLAKTIEPYVPGEYFDGKGNIIKLNTNENPYPPSPRVSEGLRLAAESHLNLYPDPNSKVLKESIANLYHVKASQVFVGNGSDEVLGFAFPAFFSKDEPVLMPDITYQFYRVYCDLFGISYREIPLDEEFQIPIEKFYNSPGGVVFANPNAPTGIALSRQDVFKILKNNPTKVVIVDEAYVDFGAESSVELVHEFPNLLVVQTLSKAKSLAGIRIGYAIGQEGLIEGLDRIKNSFNSYCVNQISMLVAMEAIRDVEYYKMITDKMIATKAWVTEELKTLGFQLTDSKTSFLWMTHPQITSQTMTEELKKQGIWTRKFNKPRIDNYLRVSIGTDEQMKRFIQAVKDILTNQIHGKQDTNTCTI